MAEFTWIPDSPSQITNKFNINSVQYGDGYMQRRANGINSLNQKIQLQFSNRTNDEIDSIDNFLYNTGGTASFTLTLVSGEVITAIIDPDNGWTRQDKEASLGGITVNILRVYE